MLPLDQTCGFGCRTLLINIRIVSCSFLQVQVNKTQDADLLLDDNCFGKNGIIINFKVDLFRCETKIVKI